MNEITDLIAEVNGWQTVTTKLIKTIETAEQAGIGGLGRTDFMSVAIAGLVENYYTAAETVLFRISQQFGNHLEQTRWHSDLLRRMSMDIPDTRPAVLSSATVSKLDELMRFRHFKRYYFQLEWDWSRLDHMVATVRALQPMLIEELLTFRAFLESLNDESNA
ncbi:MAG: hypothetical protein PF508_16880 [Spirochaeta sp.]|jgi:hypothetical protein|nr:hypothetical protein [Spirochaeta sp.]